MKTQYTINIWNPTTGNQLVTLNALREIIATRRMNALKPNIRKEFQREVTVMTTDTTLQQVAAHYKSFEIRRFDHNKAVEVFNAGGCQIATIVNK